MKCQRCSKPATYHITDVFRDDQYEEVHLCENCANIHLATPTPVTPKPVAKAAAPVAAAVNNSDLAELGNQVCDVCGIKFVEFRNTGRLGCPHDYDAFQTDLVPLLENCHGDVKHVGKTPRRLPATRATQSELTAMKRQLQAAIQKEAYEDAARLRDRIRQLEDQL